MRVVVGDRQTDMVAVWYEGGRVRFIDQRKLPGKLEIFGASGYEDVATAIREMVVRGAPAIGCAAAYGMALAMKQGADISKAAAALRATRPTAHDLFYAVDWMLGRGEQLGPVEAAERYTGEIVGKCRKIGENGASLLKDGDSILTHCNAGALATVDIGTALAPIRIARDQGKQLFVYVDETRPWLQGSRLTAWELTNESIPHAIIADNAAGHFLKDDVDCVIVGADRIAANGDFANKIGTYEKAVVARENGVPFHVAAPISTFDFTIPSGTGIRIEERREEEVTSFMDVRVAGSSERARNPVFDVTPARYVTSIITEAGVHQPSDLSALKGLSGGE